jgi:hypothetical protein
MVRFARKNITRVMGFNPTFRGQRPVDVNPDVPTNRDVSRPSFNPLSRWTIVPRTLRDGKEVLVVEYNEPYAAPRIVHVFAPPPLNLEVDDAEIQPVT